MDDLISRQATIDKFEPWLNVKGYSEGELNMLKADGTPVTKEQFEVWRGDNERIG